MTYLILSPIALSLFLVNRLGASKSVDKVYFWVGDPSLRATGKHMEDYEGYEKLELVDDYNEVLNEESKDNLIIFIDDIGMGETGHSLRKQGWSVIGGSPFADKIEDERGYAQEVVQGIMEVPETYEFESFDDGMKFAKTRSKDEVFFFKPNDSQVPKDYTYRAKNIKDLVSALKNFKDEWKWKESFQLQMEVKGQLMDFSCFIDKNGQILPNSLIYYFENKPLMNDDVGPQTGGAIAVEYAHKLEGQFYEIFQKLLPKLTSDGYYGQIAINCIIDEETKKPYFLEFCGRVGYPSLPADVTLVEDKGKTVHDLFLALVTGSLPNLFPTNKIATTIWIGIPPYPFKEGTDKNKGVPISWDKKYDSYFFPYYVMHDEKKGLVAAGVGGEILQITCCDVTLNGAVSMLMDTYLPTLRLKNAMYRTDLGKDARDRMKKLQEWKII
jgi:phosphoribosylamine--glycine ligase